MRADDSLLPSLVYGFLTAAAIALMFFFMAKQPTNDLDVLPSVVLLAFVSFCLFGHGRHAGCRYGGGSPTGSEESSACLGNHGEHRREVRRPEMSGRI